MTFFSPPNLLRGFIDWWLLPSAVQRQELFYTQTSEKELLECVPGEGDLDFPLVQQCPLSVYLCFVDREREIACEGKKRREKGDIKEAAIRKGNKKRAR